MSTPKKSAFGIAFARAATGLNGDHPTFGIVPDDNSRPMPGRNLTDASRLSNNANAIAGAISGTVSGALIGGMLGWMAGWGLLGGAPPMVAVLGSLSIGAAACGWGGRWMVGKISEIETRGAMEVLADTAGQFDQTKREPTETDDAYGKAET